MQQSMNIQKDKRLIRVTIKLNPYEARVLEANMIRADEPNISNYIRKLILADKKS